ncbi:MAG TPA: hypothetical protein EYH34_01890 [Planctomycetes bacterium]|nr:hypothetical protein [Planctomycetota bacterium]
MAVTNGYGRAVNPFCSARVRPGAIPYEFVAGQDPDRLVARLRRNGWWGQVVGHHGSGKSALVAALEPALRKAGRSVIRIELHDAQRRLPRRPALAVAGHRNPLLVIDGYEQLSRWGRWRLRRFCRRRQTGLLVTAHRSMGLPDLARTSVSLAQTQRIVAQLLGDHAHLISPDEVAARFHARQGNLREVLFDLYDLFEKRRPQAD